MEWGGDQLIENNDWDLFNVKNTVDENPKPA